VTEMQRTVRGEVVFSTFDQHATNHIQVTELVLDRCKRLVELGTDVVVLWVSPGSRQKEIRATVARFPYLQVERNDQVDVEKIPRLA